MAHAAHDVVEELSRDLSGERIGVILTDSDGHVLDRWTPDREVEGLLDRIQLAPGSVYAESAIGTNAIGTALEQGRASLVDGSEHFAQELHDMSCAAHPIMNPIDGKRLGVIDLSCAAADANPLMQPLIRRAAKDVERHLALLGSETDHLILARFARERRRGSDPLAVVSDHSILTNAAAKQILTPADREVFWNIVMPLISDRSQSPEIFLRDNSYVVTSCQPIFQDHDLVGASVRFKPAAESGDSEAHRAAAGLEHLTDTEMSVASLVSEGLTNRQAAERLFLSPYTVDSHLRSIFRKLNINSRVELTRLIIGRTTPAAA